MLALFRSPGLAGLFVTGSLLAPGDTGYSSFTITGGSGASSGGYGGLNVAVDNTRAYLEPGTGFQWLNEELTHSGGALLRKQRHVH